MVFFAASTFKIQVGGQPPCWIFFATQSLSYRKSHSEENMSNFVILDAIEYNLWVNTKFKMAAGRHVEFLHLQHIP